MSGYSIIIVDPQKGFCSDSGSLALVHDEAEFDEIRQSIPNILNATKEIARCHLVKSEYVAGQFTDGNFEHKLANLCVPNANQDCDIIDEFVDTLFLSVSIKRQQSALSSSSFRAVVDQDLADGVGCFIVAGFLLDHCVAKTAEDLSEYVKGRSARVLVCRDLSAARMQKYRNGVVDKTLSRLNRLGVNVGHWSSIRP